MNKDFRDIFVKITYVFASDMHIIHNKYITGGVESENGTVGIIVCIIKPATRDILNDVLDKRKIYSISNIKEFKAAIKNTSTNEEILNIKYIQDITEKWDSDTVDYECAKEMLHNSIETFSSFSQYLRPLFENDCTDIIDEIFDNNSVVPIQMTDIYTGMNASHDVFIGKELFPLATKSSSKKIKYVCYEITGARLMQFILSYETKYFDIIGIYYFLDLNNTTDIIRG